MLFRTRTRPIPALIALAAAAAFWALTASPASAGLVAPGSKCKAQQNVNAPEPKQEDAMRCLINYARRHAGAGGLSSDRKLERAAGRKSGDVQRCGLSHTACGRPADLYPRRYGYMKASSWAWGENLAWGRGGNGSARAVLKAWLNSGPHRDTMLRGSFDDLGLGLKVGSFAGSKHASVWVMQVGCRGC